MEKKLVKFLVKKIVISFLQSKKNQPIQTHKTKGEEIVKLLKEQAKPEKVQDKFQFVKDVYNDLL